MSVNLQKDPHSSDRDSTQAAGRNRAGQRPEGARRARRYDLVVMAASVGGIKALQAVLSALPADFPAPIAVIQHRSTSLPNLLARVLARCTPLAVKIAEQSEAMQPGTVYLAPPDLHLTVHSDGTFSLSDGRKIRHVRSSANPLKEATRLMLERKISCLPVVEGHTLVGIVTETDVLRYS